MSSDKIGLITLDDGQIESDYEAVSWDWGCFEDFPLEYAEENLEKFTEVSGDSFRTMIGDRIRQMAQSPVNWSDRIDHLDAVLKLIDELRLESTVGEVVER